MKDAKVVAVASGKGGVGKTLTATNIALCSARSGINTALVDADPLSNVMELLDINPPDKKLEIHNLSLEDSRLNIIDNLDIIYPQTKKSETLAAALVTRLLVTLREAVNNSYQLVVVDMPAGTCEESELPWLNTVDLLLLVTNPEPTAHVAAGSFIYRIRNQWKNRPLYLWHNRYEELKGEDFNPNDLIGNYNRNVDAARHLSIPSPIAIAHVPPDPSLDLARVTPDIMVDLCRSLTESLNIIADIAINPIQNAGNPAASALTAYFLRRVDMGDKPMDIVARLEKFIARESLDKNQVKLPDKFKEELLKWLSGSSPLRKQIIQARKQLTLYLNNLDSRSSDMKPSATTISSRSVDRMIIILLGSLNKMTYSKTLQPQSALLLFRFTLLKMFSWPATRKYVEAFRPERQQGKMFIRDRRRQIMQMTSRDAAYQERYFALIKRLYPIMNRQINQLVKTFRLEGLIFRNKEGNIARKAYIRLFSASIYEMINSGLGIVAGFRFRPSSRAFSAGYEKLMEVLKDGED